MVFKTIGILLAIIAVVSVENVESRVFPDESGEYDANIKWLFSVAEKNEKSETKGEEYTICNTDACKILGKELKSSMNFSADPCDNFYDFVCGGWNDKVDEIPPYEDSWGRVALFQHTVFKRVKYIMETDPEPSDILPVRQAKKWYGACMDRDEREKRGIKPIESILMRTGGWPLIMDLPEWSEDDFNWQEVEKDYFFITAKFTFYTIEPSWRRDENGLINAVRISQGNMPLEGRLRSSFRDDGDDEDWHSYKAFLKRVVKVFIKHSRADVAGETIDKDIDALIEFEKKLYEIADLEENAGYMTIGEFIANYTANVTDISQDSEIDFEILFKALLDIGNIDLDEDLEVYVANSAYYVSLTKLLSETPKRTIANYMHWNFVSDTIFYTTDEMETIWKEEIEEDTGITEKKPRWLECINDMKMKHAISYAFATKYFTESTEKTVSKMIDNIRRELLSQIQHSTWLNSEGKEVLKDKLDSMNVFIGFPDWYKNDTAVKAMYKGLKVGYDYFENMINFEKYKIREKLQYMKKKADDGPWDVSSTIVNAMYSPFDNLAVVPAADFQPPLFTPNLPDYLNYGIVGNVIGHEIGHGYDSEGIKMNKEGEETELSKQMIENYFKRAECFLHQYNKYWGVTEPLYEDTTPIFWEGSIGRKTRGENMADNTGLQSVFNAWKNYKGEQGGEQERLPGLEKYSDEQMFFIGFASPHCSMLRPKYLEKLREDVHSIPNIRVIGAVSNSQDFSRVFNCPKGSPMNPEDKCNIWKGSEKNKKPSRRRSHRRHRHSIWALDKW